LLTAFGSSCQSLPTGSASEIRSVLAYFELRFRVPNDGATSFPYLAGPPVVPVVPRVCGGFGFARNTAATFNVFYWLQVTNYGVRYVLFDSAPGGSNHIDVWDSCLHVQIAPQLFRSNSFSDESRREQA
jgi:hypothetical protein